MSESLFERRLKETLAEHIVAKRTQLSTHPAPDFASYRERVGEIRALEQVFATCEVIRRQIDGATDTPTEEPTIRMN